jgi:hypothetical protein
MTKLRIIFEDEEGNIYRPVTQPTEAELTWGPACARCGAQLVDDDGASFPYCPNCDWCPDCGVTHPASHHPKHVPGRE